MDGGLHIHQIHIFIKMRLAYKSEVISSRQRELTVNYYTQQVNFYMFINIYIDINRLYNNTIYLITLLQASPLDAKPFGFVPVPVLVQVLVV